MNQGRFCVCEVIILFSFAEAFRLACCEGRGRDGEKAVAPQ